MLSFTYHKAKPPIGQAPWGSWRKATEGEGGRLQADGNLVTGNLYASKNIDVRNYVRYTEPKR